MCLVSFCFDIDSPYCVILWCYQKIFSFPVKVSLFIVLCVFFHVKIPWFVTWSFHIVFFPHFYFLVIFVLLRLLLSVWFLVAVIRLRTHFFMKSSCHCIDVSVLSYMLVSPFPPSFLDPFTLFTSFLGCKASYIIITFLVFWSICWISSRVHFQNSPEYLPRGKAQVFIPLMRFLEYSLVSSSSVISLKYSFLFFLSSPHVQWCPLPIFRSTYKFPLLRAFWFFLDLVVLFLQDTAGEAEMNS